MTRGQTENTFNQRKFEDSEINALSEILNFKSLGVFSLCLTICFKTW